ncbi:MAG: hypothetical protein FWE88_07365 [Phycisphaerae bacterium]|nr:hypothetical protein [Phycisphaerae bacterium]
MVQESLPVKASHMTPPVESTMSVGRPNEDRRRAPQSAEKKRPRATPPQSAAPTPRTHDEGDEHEIDILA